MCIPDITPFVTLLLQVVVAIRPLRCACPGASQPFALFTWSGLYAVVAVTFICNLVMRMYAPVH